MPSQPSQKAAQRSQKEFIYQEGEKLEPVARLGAVPSEQAPNGTPIPPLSERESLKPPQPAPHEPAPPTPSTASDRAEQMNQQAAPANPLKEITLQVTRGSEIIDIQVRGAGEKVDVAVTTNQEVLSSELRHDLPSLVESLHLQGYEAAADTSSTSQKTSQPDGGPSEQPLPARTLAECSASSQFEEHQRQRNRRPDWPEEE